ncbi:MAG: LuxR C-terminal-related transcriptional regulator [Prolixibacteraceae bacterium]
MNFPAGIDEGFEIYLHEGHLRVLNNGRRSEYKDLSDEKRSIFRSEMKEGIRVMESLQLMGHSDLEEMEMIFVGCRFGTLNSAPDLEGNKTKPDAPCCDKIKECPGFGFVCRIPEHLSRQEYLISTYIGRGYLDKEICDMLNITLPTCRTHINRIHEKLHLNNRVEIALWAQNLGIV